MALSLAHHCSHSQIKPLVLRVDVQVNLASLLQDEDTDRDLRITVNDSSVAGTGRGDKRFAIKTINNTVNEVSGTYPLANLLQELKLAEEAGRDTLTLSLEKVMEKPGDHVSRNIRELYWDGLSRRIDEDGLPAIMSDEKSKSADGVSYLYVPNADSIALDYFTSVGGRHPEWRLQIVRLPQRVTPAYVRSLDGRHGILSLALRQGKDSKREGVPFVVPGGRFNEMYGWDSYFIVLGLLQDGRVELAKGMIDNMAYEIMHYGAILNANRTYYLTRSQPPFLTSMARECYAHLPKSEESKEWLKHVLEAAIREYRNVWNSEPRLTPMGLCRYYDAGTGVPPEVELGHFDVVFKRYAQKANMSSEALEQQYRSGSFKLPELDAYFVHDRCMRESGHDTSYRLEGCCADLVTVDLNSLLFKYEMDIATLIKQEFNGTLLLSNGEVEQASVWALRASDRSFLMNKFLWEQGRGMFLDYDFAQRRQKEYVSATTFYPLWAGFASREQADLLLKNALPLLEVPGGIVGSTEHSRGPVSPDHPLRQWDYPFGWAPHQMIVWAGLMNYGFDSIAHRLIYKWLYTIARNAADYNGTVTEKYDVVKRTHQVFAEYGNVGTKFAYITREGFGWTNASVQVGIKLLPPALVDSLNNLVPPESMFENR